MPLPPLYPHQARTVQQVRQAYREGARRICVVLPTGAGKTRLGMAICEGALAKGRRVLWLAHREELVDQASRSLAELGVEHGIIKAGRAAAPAAPVQVASVQTLAARPDALPPADIVIPDETHHAVADTWRAILARYPQLELLLGLTATPERGDKSPLGDIYDRLVVGATVRELQRTKRPDGATILVPCRVVAPAAYQLQLAEDPIVALYQRARRVDGTIRPSLLFAGSVQEARALAGRAREQGIRAACVDGATESRQRASSLERFSAGDLDLLTNVQVLTEGFDAPRAEVAILARGCAAACTYLQIIGRVLRSSPSTGKSDALLVDLRGVVHMHGLPDEERAYSLDGKAISRADKLALRQCPGCGAVFEAAASCPVCGAALGRVRAPARVQKAAVVEVDKVTPMSRRHAYFVELCAMARAKGWKPAAVGIRYKSRFGTWPPWKLHTLETA